jgi:hypothetical protein
MGRWRRWSLKGNTYSSTKLNLSTATNFYVVLYVFLSPVSRHTQGISNLRNLSSTMSCIVLYRNLVPLWFYQVISMPKPAGRLVLYSTILSPIKNRRNRSPVWPPLSNVRPLDSSLSIAIAEMLLPSLPPFVCAVSVIEGSVPDQADCFGLFS